MKRTSTDFICIHAADTPASMDIGVAEIREWHVTERGWSDCGYHYVIRRDGTIETGRHRDAVGAHVKGFNFVSLGICLVGGYKGLDNFTTAQWGALEELVKKLKMVYPKAEVLGHRNLSSGKDCPSFDAEKWWRDVKEKDRCLIQNPLSNLKALLARLLSSFQRLYSK